MDKLATTATVEQRPPWTVTPAPAGGIDVALNGPGRVNLIATWTDEQAEQLAADIVRCLARYATPAARTRAAQALAATGWGA